MSKTPGYIGYHADCYVISDKRTPEFIEEFLDEFLIERKEIADEFLLPMYSNTPDKVFHKASTLIEELCINPTYTSTVYWANKTESEPKGAMCFFTDDGKIIYGLYCNSKTENTEIEDRLFDRMKRFIKSEIGLIYYEEPAPHNGNKFLDMVKDRWA